MASSGWLLMGRFFTWPWTAFANLRSPARRRAATTWIDRAAASGAAGAAPTPTCPWWPTARRSSTAIRDHQVVVVAGETGSGKSTQLPKLCLELGLGVRGAHRPHPAPPARRPGGRPSGSPRSSAPRSARPSATRSASTTASAPDTFIKVMTDGILLAEIQRDRLLRAYEVLIIDEAHERSLNIDFLLGYLRQLLPQRPDLKVIITSATIDTARFAAHFGDAPVVEVSGRSYPVEVRYRPVGEEAGDDRDQTQAICDAVQELHASRPRRHPRVPVRRARDPRHRRGARPARPARHRAPPAVRPPLGRRAAPGVRAAPGSAHRAGHQRGRDVAHRPRHHRRRRPRHRPHLPLQPAHEGAAPADRGDLAGVGRPAGRPLRARRARHVHPPLRRGGLRRPPASSPSRRSCARTWRRSSCRWPRSASATSPPSRSSSRPTPAAIKDGILLLEELGALDRGGDRDHVRLTKLGRRLARIPADPRLARMVLEADRHGVVAEVLVLAAALSIQDPRERPTGEEQAAPEQHQRFADPESDFLAYLNLWRYLREQQKARGSSQFRRMCKAEHLHHLRIREWQDVHSQLRQVARGIGLEVASAGRRARPRRHPPGAARRPAVPRRHARPRRQRVPRRPRGALRARPGTGARASDARSGSWRPSSSRPTGCAPAPSPRSSPTASSRPPVTSSPAATTSRGGTRRGARR